MPPLLDPLLEPEPEPLELPLEEVLLPEELPLEPLPLEELEPEALAPNEGGGGLAVPPKGPPSGSAEPLQPTSPRDVAMVPTIEARRMVRSRPTVPLASLLTRRIEGRDRALQMSCP